MNKKIRLISAITILSLLTVCINGPPVKAAESTGTKTVTITIDRTDTNFPSTVNYNSGGFTGTLTKTGSYTTTGSPADSKYITFDYNSWTWDFGIY